MLTREQMLEDLEALRSSVQSAWSYRPYRAERGVDLDEISDRLQAQLPVQATLIEFFDVLQQFTAALHDGHVWVAPTPGPKCFLPGRFRETDEGIVVEHWAAGGCRVGDRLLSIDGRPVELCLEERMLRSSASTEPSRRSHGVRSLARLSNSAEACLELESPQGELSQVRCLPGPEWKPAEEPISHRILPDGTGYLRVANFQQDREMTARLGLDAGLHKHFTLAREALEAVHDCPALVVDLRGNGGGSDRLGLFLAGAFLPEGSVYYELETHSSPELGRQPVLVHREPLSPMFYSGRLAVLCDEETFSAADCFLSALVHHLPDTLVVGRENGAGAGAPRTVARLPHSQVNLTCSVMRVWTAGGELLEGHPLPLDCELRPSQADIAAGRDVQLEAAVSLLSE